jgi:serine/threonine-protein kinase HipA
VTDALQVIVNGNPVGELHKEDGEYIFYYRAGVQAEHFISLTMPVRFKGYSASQLLPLFEMHLPEGYLEAVIKKHFAKLVATDHLGLLKLLAPSIRGRVQYASEQDTEISPITLQSLLSPISSELFTELVQRFALRSPLSGVQPKVLTRVQNKEIQHKATLKLDEYIVKAWGDDYPQLALNEYYCMMAAKLADIDVPEFYLSDDDALFILKRFDITETGESLGFEDMCVLQAKQRDDKYTGSYEQVAKSIKSFVSPINRSRSLEQFFKMVVLNNALQNGDAHLKNFGVVYSNHQDVRLAPAYDMVSTSAYISSDVPALTLFGSKRWWDKKNLIRFAVESCDLTPSKASRAYQACQIALQELQILIQQRRQREQNAEKSRLLDHLSALVRRFIA